MEILERKTEGIILDSESDLYSLLGLQEHHDFSEFLPIDHIRESDITIPVDTDIKEFSINLDDIDF